MVRSKAAGFLDDPIALKTLFSSAKAALYILGHSPLWRETSAFPKSLFSGSNSLEIVLDGNVKVVEDLKELGQLVYDMSRDRLQ
jgi:hypothetical protein